MCWGGGGGGHDEFFFRCTLSLLFTIPEQQRKHHGLWMQLQIGPLFGCEEFGMLNGWCSVRVSSIFLFPTLTLTSDVVSHPLLLLPYLHQPRSAVISHLPPHHITPHRLQQHTLIRTLDFGSGRYVTPYAPSLTPHVAATCQCGTTHPFLPLLPSPSSIARSVVHRGDVSPARAEENHQVASAGPTASQAPSRPAE